MDGDQRTWGDRTSCWKSFNCSPCSGRRSPKALFRPQLTGEELGETHESLFQGDLRRTALGSSRPILLGLRRACEARERGWEARWVLCWTPGYQPAPARSLPAFSAAFPMHHQYLPTRPVSSVHSSAVGWQAAATPGLQRAL